MNLVSIILIVMFLCDNIIRIGMDKLNDPDEDSVDSFSRCYEELGCIETNSRWYDKKLRPVNFPPVDRHIIKTDFLLIKTNKTDSDNLLYNNMMAKFSSITSAGYNNGSDIIILIHDFTANGYTGWIKHLAKVILNETPHTNVISVDWQRGAEPPYDQAISNARVVALEVILLLKELKEKAEINLNKVHIIGHGVGAHIAGYVGATYNNIKKITGLDPSGPRFEGLPDIVKLNPSNAKYVEILHTDAYDSRSQGTRETMGHSDFYINDALIQPDCPVNNSLPNLVNVERNSINGGEISPGCSHKRAFKYFIESLSRVDCVFFGIKCDNYEEFSEGKCASCGKSDDTCRTFGLVTYKNSVEKSSFYLNTAGHPPYCMYVYKVTIFIRDGEYFGYFDFILVDDNAHVAEASLADSSSNDRHFKSGANSYVYYVQPPRLGRLKEIKVRWNEKKKLYCFIFCKQVIEVEKIGFKFLGTGHNDERGEDNLCPTDSKTEIENGSYRTFINCNNSSESAVILTESPTTSTESPINSTESPTTSTESPINSTESPNTSTEPPNTSTGSPITLTESPTTSKESPTTSKESPTTSKESPTTSKESPTTSKDSSIASKESPTTWIEHPTLSIEPPTSSIEPPVTSNGSPNTHTGLPTTSIEPPTSPKESVNTSTMYHIISTESPTSSTTTSTISAVPPTTSSVSESSSVSTELPSNKTG